MPPTIKPPAKRRAHRIFVGITGGPIATTVLELFDYR
jgi:hypothetical protein